MGKSASFVGGASLSRRRFLRGMALVAGLASSTSVLAACSGTSTPVAPAGPTAAAAPAATAARAAGPTSAPAPAAPSAGQSAEWDRWVAAAKQEAKVVVNTQPGAVNRTAIAEFEKAYPGVAVEHTGLQLSNQFTPRIQQEREAGVYTWDVALIPTVTALAVLRPMGVWDPIKPVLVQPEAIDDKAWRGGFDDGWRDLDKQIAYGFTNDRGESLWINTDVVKPDDIPTVEALLDPKWKGKIVAADPRVLGNGFWPATMMRLRHGEDIIRRLWVDQEPAISRDARQISEFLVRGRYPIGIGPAAQVLREFQQQHLGNNIVGVELDEIAYLGGTAAFLLNKAPHPNAARVFLNWLLTRDGQAAFASNVQTNSRRADVEPGEPATYPTPGRTYTQIDSEEIMPKLVETQEIAKRIMG
jgi:iron(III) transport system substrate-binding protein